MPSNRSSTKPVNWKRVEVIEHDALTSYARRRQMERYPDMKEGTCSVMLVMYPRAHKGYYLCMDGLPELHPIGANETNAKSTIRNII